MPKTMIFLASRTEQENYILQKKLEPLEYEFRGLGFAGVHPVGLPASVDQMTAAVVFNFNEWTNKEAVHLDELKRIGYRGPVLVIAKGDVTKAVRAAKATPNLLFLEKPFEMKDLLGIIRKMLLARAVAQRVHRRFATSQDAEVSFLTSGGSMTSRVRNLSKGGAYLEFMQPAPIKVGELVSLKLELKDVNRTYSMHAKVVWTSRTNTRGAGVGVEFVGREGMK
jgi:hypothetical protein